MEYKIKNKKSHLSGSLFSIPRSLFFCLFVLFSILYSAFSIPNIASAEAILPTVDETEATVLTITPSIFEAVVAPGKTTAKVFELKNGSNFPLPIKSYIRLFDASDEVGGVTIPEEMDARRLSPQSWIGIVAPDFIMQPQSSRRVEVNFNPPKDLPPGGYYAILFAEPLIPESFLSKSSLQIGGRIGSLLLLIGPGDIKEKGQIATFNLPRFIWGSGTAEALIRFQNQGNVHLRPNGKMVIKNLIGKKEAIIKIPEFTVLPGKIRQQKVKVEGLKWPGVYRTKLQLIFGHDKIVNEEVLTFYYLPLKQIVIIMVVMGVLVILFWGKTRRRVMRAFSVIIKGSG